MRTTLNPFADRTMFRRTAGGLSPKDLPRREFIGLIGATLIFLVGLPGHSTTFVSSAQVLAKNLVRLVLVFLGLAAPSPVSQPIATAQAPVIHTKPAAPVVRFVKPIKDPNSMSTYSHYRLYTYKFEGQATHQGAACPKASVLVRIISEAETVTRGAITDDNGAFSIEVPVRSMEGVPVDWKIEAYTPEFEKLEMAGRRIVQEEEEHSSDPIVVTTPVEFVVSMSNPS